MSHGSSASTPASHCELAWSWHCLGCSRWFCWWWDFIHCWSKRHLLVSASSFVSQVYFRIIAVGALGTLKLMHVLCLRELCLPRWHMTSFSRYDHILPLEDCFVLFSNLLGRSKCYLWKQRQYHGKPISKQLHLVWEPGPRSQLLYLEGGELKLV